MNVKMSLAAAVETLLLAGFAVAGCADSPSHGAGASDAAVADVAPDSAIPDAALDAETIPCGALSCRPGELCLHVCDCCGTVTSDGGPEPSGHDECIADTGQCEDPGTFTSGASQCSCSATPHVAECPCS